MGVGVGELKHILSLQGWELLDAAAAIVQKSPPPTQAALPLRSPEPERLTVTRDSWKAAADLLDNHIEEVRVQLGAVLANWDVPVTLQPYMSKMLQLLMDQKAAMEKISGIIKEIQDLLEKGKGDTEDRGAQAAITVVSLIVAAIAGMVAGVLTGGAVSAAALAALAGTLAGLFTALLAWLYARSKAQREGAKGLDDQLEALQEAVDKEVLAKVTPPKAPDLGSIRSFRSVYQPGTV